MNSINSVGASSPVQQTQSVAPKAEAAVESSTPARRSDSVELSGLSGFMQVLRNNDIRADKVADIRAQIDAGTYETDDKLTIAADRLLEDL